MSAFLYQRENIVTSVILLPVWAFCYQCGNFVTSFGILLPVSAFFYQRENIVTSDILFASVGILLPVREFLPVWVFCYQCRNFFFTNYENFVTRLGILLRVWVFGNKMWRRSVFSRTKLWDKSSQLSANVRRSAVLQFLYNFSKCVNVHKELQLLFAPQTTRVQLL